VKVGAAWRESGGEVGGSGGGRGRSN